MREKELKIVVKAIIKEFLNEGKPQYEVHYAVLGLEGIEPSEHETKAEAWMEARKFIDSYNSPKSKAAGEKIVHISNGYALHGPGGGTRAIAVVVPSGMLKEGKWKNLAAAGLLGYAAIKGWPQQASSQQITFSHPKNDPLVELPSEKNMDSWDLANKYSERNANLAAKLKPAVTNWLKENADFERWDIKRFQILKKTYERALRKGESSFFFGDREITVPFAKLLIQYLEQYFSNMKESIDSSSKSDDDALYVEYVSERPNEAPFLLHGEKFQFVNGKYPSGRVDIAVYATRGDIVYGYKAWQQRYGIKT